MYYIFRPRRTQRSNEAAAAPIHRANWNQLMFDSRTQGISKFLDQTPTRGYMVVSELLDVLQLRCCSLHEHSLNSASKSDLHTFASKGSSVRCMVKFNFEKQLQPLNISVWNSWYTRLCCNIKSFSPIRQFSLIELQETSMQPEGLALLSYF